MPKLLSSVLLSIVVAAVPAIANPLKTASLPVCGPADANFHRLFAALHLREVWRGTHENGHGDIRLTVNSSGAWSMFYYTTDAAGAERVCVIARGFASREGFGRPV